MDSLTHIVFGAALGEAMLGKKIGHKAALIGAIANSLPDIDVVATMLIHDDLRYLEVHRSYSHAALTLILISFPLASLFNRWFKDKFSYGYWYTFWCTALLTHSLLDGFTTFGIQLLLPFSNMLIGFNNLSIIDPLFTLPVTILVVICLFLSKENPLRLSLAKSALTYCCIYLVFTFGMKYKANSVFKEDLASKNILANGVYTTPTMLNCLLWSGIAVTQDSIYTGEYSVLQKSNDVKWLAFPKNDQALDVIPLKDDIATLKWFSQGKYFVWQQNDTIKFFNIKWGRADYRYQEPEKTFLFYFQFYKENGVWKRSVVEPKLDGKIGDAIRMIFNRIMDKPLPPVPLK